MRLRVPVPVPCGTPVEVDAGEIISLGEVCRCKPLGDAYEVGVQLSQTLIAGKELNKLHRALLKCQQRVRSRARS
jgi:hypothetical protein